MIRLSARILRLTRALDRAGNWALPTVARLVFAGVLLAYFWAAALTKFDGIFTPSAGAFAQIYPRAFAAAAYDLGQMGVVPKMVVLLGGWAEFGLPLLLVLGLFTRLAALGMIGFVALQSLTDVYGHLADAATIGTWFDRMPDASILDQRAFWVVLLLVLVFKGAGPLSLDARIKHRVWG